MAKELSEQVKVKVLQQTTLASMKQAQSATSSAMQTLLQR